VNRVLVAVVVALIAAFAAIGVLSGEDEEPQAAPERDVRARLAQVARDVERARELDFERLPRVRLVTPEEAVREALRDLDREVPRREQLIHERFLELLGLLAPDVALRDVLGEALGEQVAGYYVPRTDTMALVRGVGLRGFLAEITLAHELVHALEDQHFGLEADGGVLLTDRSVADAALREGTATVAMVDYMALSQAGTDELPADLRTQVLEQLEGVTVPASSGLPRYVRESLVFPYAAGGRFVDRVQGEGGWAAVDRAFEEDPPLSSEQIMHPEKYESGERPVTVRLRGVRAELPDGARRLLHGDLGEFDTAQFLREANGRERSEDAAAGWGGSAFELWRLPDGGEVLAMAWAWDTPRDAAEFAAAARRSVERLRSAGAVNGGKEGVAVVLAPEAPLASRLAGRVVPG
jgi:hypothetical protein